LPGKGNAIWLIELQAWQYESGKKPYAPHDR
jgi:hypothetical protein